MEIQVGGNSFQQDRPGTRMRIVLRPEDSQKPGRVRVAFSWMFKLVIAVAAGVFCVAIVSYAPFGGPAISAFVPTHCTLLVQAPSGAALHRALVDDPAFNEALNDPDTAAFVASFSKSQSPNDSESDAADAAPRSVHTLIDSAFAKLPWPVSLVIQPNASGLYPFVGGECALALEPSDDPSSPAKKGAAKALIFTRLSGSSGHLARLGLVFFSGTKSVAVFDLGGGLIAIGFNGARPAFEPHAPPMVVSTHTTAAPRPDSSPMPLLRVSFSPRAPGSTPVPKEQPLDLTQPGIGRLFEEGVPESVLKALISPPTVGDMLNWKAPPALARIDFVAGTNGTFSARGRIEGDVPNIVHNSNASSEKSSEPRREESSVDFLPGAPMAEFVLPIDLRACFLKHVEGAMKMVSGATTLTRGQQMWSSRFQVLATDRVDLDASLWPAIGHVAILHINEAKKDEGATPMGTIKAWLPSFIQSPETYFALADLARARWDYVFDHTDPITVKTQFVKRFRAENPSTDPRGDRFVLATGKINAPAWSIGSRGLRITTDAGPFALLRGPDETEFIAPPAALNAYRARLDGARLAPTVESLVTLYYDELEAELGSQKFLAQNPDRKLNIRLANKASCLLGRIALEIVPDTTGADINANWKLGSIASAAPKTAGNAIPSPGQKKDSKKIDDDDAPPPPPGN